MNRFCASLLWVVACGSTVFGQTVIVDDDFEGYANEAALHAVWAGIPITNQAAVEDAFVLTVETVGGAGADYNGDGIVDAADYVLWRKDPVSHGGDPAGYEAWRAQFGGPPSGGGGEENTYVFRPVTGEPPLALAGALRYNQPLDPGFPDGSIFPSQGLEPIVLRGDIQTLGADGLGRNSIALRRTDGGAANLWEMGVYNDGSANPPAPAGTTGAATHGIDPDGDGPLTGQNVAFARFAVRAQLFQGTNPNWLFFAMDPLWDTDGNGLVTSFEAFAALGVVNTPSWHTLEATFAPVDGGASGEVLITATLDLLADGMNNAQGTAGVDGTITISGLTVSQAGFDDLRFGGPSALTSSTANGFDNIFLSGPRVAGSGGLSAGAVPEPTAIGLALLATLGLLAPRRCRG